MLRCRFADGQSTAVAQLAGGVEHHAAFEVSAGGTLELTLAQFWKSPGASTLAVEVEWHGLRAAPCEVIHLDGAVGNAVLQV